MKRDSVKKVRLYYRETDDTFVLDVWDEFSKSWGLVCSCQCQETLKSEKVEFIHFSILNELAGYIRNGYKLV